MTRMSTGRGPSRRDGAGDWASLGEDPSTRLVDLTAYYGHLRCFQGIRPLVVKTNRFTYAPSYPPNDRMQNTWLSIALEGIETLFAHPDPGEVWRDVAVIGTGNGLDAIGISRIVRPERIVASDIHPRALQAARWNVANHVGERCRVTFLQSDLFEAYPEESRFDLIYENLPNIPDGKELLEGIRSASFYEPRAREAASMYDRYLLTLHHDFLIEARSHLHPCGWIVCVIGGRVPADVILGMFREAGYRPTIAGFGVKIQSEADVVLPAYAAAEQETGLRFDYYHPLDACVSLLHGLQQPDDLRDREKYARSLVERLSPLRISSTDAARLNEEGMPVCHTVHVIAARRISGEDARA
jgi:hypothetical protein